jgi:UDP-2,3-diacylglucosamine hydrolase
VTAGLREIHAPEPWRTLDFISDLHLHAGDAQTVEVWRHYMACTPADALFILGDLFEVWVGDDQLDAPNQTFATECAQVLRACGQRLALFFMHGNRDFLLGPQFLAHCQGRLLDDPCVLTVGGQRWLLAHGDALCLEDHSYLEFRAQVRSEPWQQAFMGKPLAQRQDIARQLRAQSQQQQAQRWARGEGYAEVDAQAARQALQDAQAHTLIHGHTHRPARHELGDGLAREVLSDWDAQRAQVLRMTVTAQGDCVLQRLSLL